MIKMYEVKTLLGISNTSNDALIDMLIPIIYDEIITYTNNNFKDENGVISYPLGLKTIVAQMINYRINKPKDGLSAESIDGYSATFDKDIMAGYPSSIMKSLIKYRKLKR